MGGSIFGLHAFHASNLTLIDQLRELGASKRAAAGGRAAGDRPRRHARGPAQAGAAGRGRPRSALVAYFKELKKNTIRGNRADDGRDEMGLAFAIDIDLTAILAELEPSRRVSYMLPGTSVYLARHPAAAVSATAAPGREAGRWTTGCDG